jgi:8-amino-7-oxononanoate synthase
METKQPSSLAQYARRRFVLSGTSVVKDHYPYCTSMESLGLHKAATNKIISFAHYDYLDLSTDQRIKSAAKGAIDTIGVGVGASRLVGGELHVHRQLEREFADFIGVEDTLSLVSGYGTNVSLVSHLLTKDDLILVDQAAHNSLMVGTQLSRAETVVFRHNDMSHLNALLTQNRARYTRVLVVVEGLYSMDGDLPDLPKLIAICRQHSAWLMIDEAHSIGVLGKTGRGISEHFDIAASEIDLIVGTLSKAFVTCGGFIGGKGSVIEWLRYTLAGFVYSVGLSPPTVAAARAALQILRAEPSRLNRLRANSTYFLEAARERGLNIGNSVGAAVVPVLFNDTHTAIAAANAALQAGYFVPPIVQIAVPKDLPRLRFFVTAAHTLSEIDGVLDVLASFEQPGVRAGNLQERRGSPCG